MLAVSDIFCHSLLLHHFTLYLYYSILVYYGIGEYRLIFSYQKNGNTLINNLDKATIGIVVHNDYAYFLTLKPSHKFFAIKYYFSAEDRKANFLRDYHPPFDGFN